MAIYVAVRVYLGFFSLFLIFRGGHGKAHPNFGIYGGKPIKITDAPFFAILREEKSPKSYCGASIISERFLVTAGHCGMGIINGGYDITIGADTINNNSGKRFEIEKVIIHPSFTMLSATHDIAVIKLKNEIEFSDTAKPLKMADKDFVINDGDIARAMGFGITENGTRSDVLLQVDLPIVNQEKCKEILKCINDVDDSMICAGWQKNKGICNGDSGGALTYKDQLVGVVSWLSPRCGHEDLPGVFARATYLKDFVDKVIKENE